MNQLIQSKNFRTFIVLAAALVGFALCTVAQAVVPAPDGGYPGGNTAEGTNALFSLTTGVYNTALGLTALFHVTDGDFNTATGAGALFSNNGDRNTAHGINALRFNTAGDSNTAIGTNALYHNTTSSNNTAVGDSALFSNTTGSFNTANGAQALLNNTTSGFNTANGFQALVSNTTGGGNTAIGRSALGKNTSGDTNIALGFLAGSNLTTGNNNIDIGNAGVAGESSTIRIGTQQTKTFIAGIRTATLSMGVIVPVLIDQNGQLGTVLSSRRFKNEIKPMDQTSEGILALKPVTFHYKDDSKGTPQFGLIAEEVAEVNPDLVVRDEEGKTMSVRYDAINAMLLNEFIKEHRKVEHQDRKLKEQEVTIAQLKKDLQATSARQQKQIEALTAGLQKVSVQLELSKPATQTVLNNQ